MKTYDSLCSIFNLRPLLIRRHISDLTFFNKLLHNKVDCPYLVGETTLKVPSTLRRLRKQSNLFYTDSRLLCRKHSFMPRILNKVNQLSLYDDLIYKPPNQFERFITKRV